MKTIKKAKNLKGKRVLVRVDFDVATDGKFGAGEIIDDTRIRENIPTIEYLVLKGAKVICVAKRRRPKGKRVESMSMKVVVERLKKYLPRKKIILVDNFLTENKKFKKQKNKEILILENIRFYPEERKSDRQFGEKLAGLADIFVSDAFAMIHRNDASVFQVPNFLPSYAGLLLEKEIKGLDKVIKKAKKPFVVVLGGAKIETKLPVMKNLLPKADKILVGGGIFNTFLLAKGYKIGDSIVDKKLKKEALDYCKKRKVITPIDVVVGTKNGKKFTVVDIKNKSHQVCKKGQAIFDIGPKTIQKFSVEIKKAQTLIWNGAMGYFEQKPYDVGTLSIARLVASRSKGKAFGVIGGGETLQSMDIVGMKEHVDLVSTGGGALLEYLSGEKLPGIVALEKK